MVTEEHTITRQSVLAGKLACKRSAGKGPPLQGSSSFPLHSHQAGPSYMWLHKTIMTAAAAAAVIQPKTCDVNPHILLLLLLPSQAQLFTVLSQLKAVTWRFLLLLCTSSSVVSCECWMSWRGLE